MTDRWIVPGSERSPLPGSRVLGDADLAERTTVTLLVRSKESGTPPPGALSRAAFTERYGADAADLQKVEDFARAHGLTVVDSSAGRRTVVVRGTVAQLSAAFGVTLKRCQAGDVSYRGREGSVSVPADLAGVVQAVLGLDNRPQAATRVRIAAQPTASFTPTEIARLYDFPRPRTEAVNASASSSWVAASARLILPRISPDSGSRPKTSRWFPSMAPAAPPAKIKTRTLK